jgi:hypothetical protein
MYTGLKGNVSRHIKRTHVCEVKNLNWPEERAPEMIAVGEGGQDSISTSESVSQRPVEDAKTSPASNVRSPVLMSKVTKPITCGNETIENTLNTPSLFWLQRKCSEKETTYRIMAVPLNGHLPRVLTTTDYTANLDMARHIFANMDQNQPVSGLAR